MNESPAPVVSATGTGRSLAVSAHGRSACTTAAPPAPRVTSSMPDSRAANSCSAAARSSALQPVTEFDSRHRDSLTRSAQGRNCTYRRLTAPPDCPRAAGGRSGRRRGRRRRALPARMALAGVRRLHRMHRPDRPSRSAARRSSANISGRDLCFVEEQVGRGIAVEGELAVARSRRARRRPARYWPDPVRNTVEMSTSVCAQHLEDVRAEGVLADLRDHLRLCRRAARLRSQHWRARRPRHARTARTSSSAQPLLLRHEINEQFTDCHYFFHRFIPQNIVGKSPARRRFPYCCR